MFVRRAICLFLKRFIWNVLGVFVFLRFRSIWALYEYIYEKKLTKGILVSVFQNCVDVKGAYVGLGAKIIGNIRIGNNCRIGANAVVYEDMPDNSIAVCSPPPGSSPRMSL